jgi:putative endonuclease
MPSSPTIELGKLGEQYAAAYLDQLGYRFVAANFTLPVGRDLRGAIVNAEVKTRASDWFAPPQANVDLRTRRQLARAARAYRRLFEVEDQPYRFDVVTVVLADPPAVELFRNYFAL